MKPRVLNRLIRYRRLLKVEGLRRRRIYDPEWTSEVGLTVHSLEVVRVFRCAEVAELVGVTPRMVRILAAEGRSSPAT
jgi:hypothetical protein